MAAAANKDMESRFDAELVKGGCFESPSIARQLVVMLNGLLMLWLMTHNTAYGLAFVEGVGRLLGASDKAVVSKASERHR